MPKGDPMSSVTLEDASRIVKPRMRAPQLAVPTVGGGHWNLEESAAERFTVIFFYRGLHCPICRKQLGELDRKLDEFEHRGSEVVAISGDTAERAQQSKREWRLERLTIGCEMQIGAMRDWGLFISHAIKEDEPEYFSEPAVFMIERDGTVFFEAINSAPFARPPIGGLLEAIDFVTENDYPARGEV
jgi:peroxiredoxin